MQTEYMKAGTPKKFSVNFVLRFGELSPSIEHCSPDEFVEYLKQKSHVKSGGSVLDHMSCCAFQGGFLITVDGKPWNEIYGLDEFWMTFTWLHGLKQLLERSENPCKSSASPWEESSMVLQRDGDVLSFIDINVYPQADVLFKPFVQAMIDESRKFFPWAKAMKEYITNLSGSTEKKDNAIHLLSPITSEMLDEMEKMLNK